MFELLWYFVWEYRDTNKLVVVILLLSAIINVIIIGIAIVTNVFKIFLSGLSMEEYWGRLEKYDGLPSKYNHTSSVECGTWFWGDIVLFLYLWFVKREPVYLSTIVCLLLFPSVTIIGTVGGIIRLLMHTFLFSKISIGLPKLSKKAKKLVDHTAISNVQLLKSVDLYMYDDYGKIQKAMPMKKQGIFK